MLIFRLPVDSQNSTAQKNEIKIRKIDSFQSAKCVSMNGWLFTYVNSLFVFVRGYVLCSQLVNLVACLGSRHKAHIMCAISSLHARACAGACNSLWSFERDESHTYFANFEFFILLSHTYTHIFKENNPLNFRVA